MNHDRFLARGLALLAAASALACGNTPTEITPLPRAIGEVEALLLDVDSLQRLDPPTEGVYHVWALLERADARRMGRFNIGESGQPVDLEGNPVRRFEAEDFELRKTLQVLITVEPEGNQDDSPSGAQVLSGTFVDGVAQLSVPISTDISNARGSLRVYTPTDGPDTNETSGVWLVDLEGAPSVTLPDTTAALQYELFIEIGDNVVNLGRFDRADQSDNFCRFCSDVEAPPERPGDDLLTGAPEGLAFPLDLSGARVTVSLEGRNNDFFTRSRLIVLDATLPTPLAPDQIVAFVNRTGSFPTGRAVLY